MDYQLQISEQDGGGGGVGLSDRLEEYRNRLIELEHSRKRKRFSRPEEKDEPEQQEDQEERYQNGGGGGGGVRIEEIKEPGPDPDQPLPDADNDWEYEGIDIDQNQNYLNEKRIIAEDEDLAEEIYRKQLVNRKYPRIIRYEWDEDGDELPSYGPDVTDEDFEFEWIRRDQSWCFLCIHCRNVDEEQRFHQVKKMHDLVDSYWGKCDSTIICTEMQRQFKSTIRPHLPKRGICRISGKQKPQRYWWKQTIYAHWVFHVQYPIVIKQIRYQTTLTIEYELYKIVRKKNKKNGRIDIISSKVRDLITIQNQNMKLETDLQKATSRSLLIK